MWIAFLNLISKSRLPLSRQLPPFSSCSLFSLSLCFSLLFLHCHVNVFSLILLDSLNFKVASQLILKLKVTFIGKNLTQF